MWGTILAVSALGIIVLGMGLGLALTSGSVFGYVLAGMGGVATQVGVIAMGVRLGTDH